MSGKVNVLQVLKILVDNENISVIVDGKVFIVNKLEVVWLIILFILVFIREGKKSEIGFIFYIMFGVFRVFIFIVGFIVLVVRCCWDWCESSFFYFSDVYYEFR